jgi:hypothetical protein
MERGLGIDRLAFENQRLTDFANAISNLYAALYDEAPAGVESIVEEGALVCRIQGGLTAGDLMMLQYGHANELATYRESFFRAVADQLAMAVTAYTGYEALTQEATFDPATVITTLRFELGPAVQDATEQRQALRNWAEQVRRNSHRLKALQAKAFEAQHDLTMQLRKDREKRERSTRSKA